MTQKQYDVVVIGAGPGGYVAAIRAAQLGLKTACIEKRGTLGGTCLNVGCIPSKALLQSTEYYDVLARHGKEHGINAEKISYDFDAMQKRKDSIVESLVSGVDGLCKKNKIDTIKGTARFINPQQLEVTDESGSKSIIEGSNIIIATGSDSISLPFLPFDEEKIVSSTGALAFKQVPKKMVVIGGGVIGVELASVYNRLGSEVTVIEMLDRICPMMDQAVSKTLLQVLKKQGIIFHLGAKVIGGQKNTDGVTITALIEGKEQAFQVDAALVSIGRKPAASALGLQEIGIQLTPKGFVPVDGLFRTTHPSIYAIGDVVDGAMLAHRASEEGIAVAEIIAGHRPKINYMAIPNVIYTNPEVASIGLTEHEAKEASLAIKIGIYQFKGNARARCHGNTEGFVKVIGEAVSGRLVGMHIIGPNASEMIGEGVLALTNKNTLAEIAEASHAHPTLAEAIKEACLSALGRPIHG